jgi:putative membrane protein
MSTTSLHPDKVKNARKLIIVLSIVIPLAVAILFKVKIPGYDLSFLPPFYAGINGLTAILLIGALIAIKNKNINLHQTLIQSSLFLSVLFLLCYVAYHITSDSTEYKGELPGVYFPLLISHIVLSVAVIPMVLFTYLFAWQGDYVRHKKWTKFAFPIWLYVAVTGVIVYFMISPFYTH